MTMPTSDPPRSPKPAGPAQYLTALAVCAGLIAAASTLAAPAKADPMGDAFLSALNNAGVSYANPVDAVALGQSICPMLAQPGGNFASVASSMAGNNGLSPDLTGLFTSIAISMYCPGVMGSIGSGNWVNALPFWNTSP